MMGSWSLLGMFLIPIAHATYMAWVLSPLVCHLGCTKVSEGVVKATGMGGTLLGVFLMPHVHGMGTVASHLPSWMCSGCWSANKVLAKWEDNGTALWGTHLFGCFQFPSAVHGTYVAWALSPLVCCPGCALVPGLQSRC